MKPHGKNYILSGRYGYTAIDATQENTSGTEIIMTGIKPKKHAHYIYKALKSEQLVTLESCIESILLGESANSEELYLYATNTRKWYVLWGKPQIVKLKHLLDTYGDIDRWKDYELQSIVRCLITAFEHASEMYEKESPRGGGNEWYNFTRLDYTIAAYKFITHYIVEYNCNKLEGYEE